MKKLILFIFLLLVSCHPVSIEPVGKATTVTSILGVGSPAYGIVIYPHQKLVFMPDVNTLSWNEISPEPGSMYVGGDFKGDNYDTMYVISYPFSDLRKVDIGTGITSVIGQITLWNGGGWTGMTWGGEMYLSSTNGIQSYLYTVDLETGSTFVVGEICNDCSIIDIAITPDNIMYGVDIHTDTLMRIDPSTAHGTTIGGIGFNASYAQDLDYDDAHRLLYLASYNKDTMQGELRVADVNTGKTTLVGIFPNGDEVDCFAFATPKVNFIKNYLPIVMKYASLSEN